MQDARALSKSQLVELLVHRDQEIAKRDDVIRQLEGKLQLLETDYLKLWRERFAAKSERYIENPD